MIYIYIKMTAPKKVKSDKEREEERCGGCDCYETDDGCECRRVPCSRCGCMDHMYNMNHPDFHSDYWFEGLSFHEKLSTILCDDCINGCSDDDKSYEDEEEGGRWN